MSGKNIDYIKYRIVFFDYGNTLVKLHVAKWISLNLQNVNLTFKNGEVYVTDEMENIQKILIQFPKVVKRITSNLHVNLTLQLIPEEEPRKLIRDDGDADISSIDINTDIINTIINTF